MGIFSKFEGRMEDTLEGAAGAMNNSPISPVQIMKKAEKQMRREKIVSAGREFAPTLYTVLVNEDDDQRLFGFYPTLAGETETRLESQAAQDGLAMDCKPLVRFIADSSLRHGKFDVIAEVVSPSIIAQLRDEEMQRYGMSGKGNAYGAGAQAARGAQQAYQQAGYQQPYQQAYQQQAQPQQQAYNQQFDQPFGAPQQPASYAAQQPIKPPLPNVAADQIDYNANYGEYTFNSANFQDMNAQNQAQAQGQNQAQNQAQATPAQQEAPAQDSVMQGIDEPASAPHSQGFSEQPNPATAQAYPGAFPATYPAGGAGAFPDVAQVAQAAGGMAGVPAQAAYAGVPSTVAFTAGAGQANPIPNQNAVRACLIDVASNRSYDLATNRVLLGRETTNDIVVNDLNSSRQHAQIEFEPQGVWVITDLGSTNGTLVNGAPITRRGLADGDRITLGITDFIFSLR